jgi:predicted kinase
MTKLIATRGLPGSGKSTLARTWMLEAPESRVVVNRDNTRFALYGKYADLPPGGENLVSHAQHGMIETFLRKGKDVYVDDTNLNAKFAKELLKLAARVGAEFEWDDRPLDVPVQTCIARDIARGAKGERRVGQDVIMSFYNRYLKNGRPQQPTLVEGSDLTQFQPYTGTPGKPDVFLVDIDGTIASNGPLDRSNPHRSFYEWSKVGKDSPIEAIIEIVRALETSGFTPLYVSGRDGVCYEETRDWIDRHVYGFEPTFNPHDFTLLMRPEGDTRKDSIVKLEIFDTYIRDNYNVKFCIDDRDQVVAAYRGIGLTVLQVAEGNF